MSLLQMSLQGAAMIAAVLVARSLLLNKLPKVVFMVLWGVVMVRLLVPFDIPLAVSAWTLVDRVTAPLAQTLVPTPNPTVEEDAALTPAVSSVVDGAADAAGTASAELQEPGYTVTFSGDAPEQGSPVVDVPGITVTDAAASGDGTSAEVVPPASAAGDSSTTLAAEPVDEGPLTGFLVWARSVYLVRFAWAAGAVALALFFMSQYLRGLSEFGYSTPVVDPYADQWLAKHPIRRPLRIREHERIQSPVTYGLARPIILVPPTFDWNNRGRASYMLMHEWVHVTRWDAVYKLALVAALCLHWFNPFVWAMYFLANRDIELACDERVVALLGPGGRKAYAHTLLDAAERNGALAPLASAFGKSAIEERIVAIVNVKQMTLAALVVSLALVAGISVAFATSAVEQDAEGAAAAPVSGGVEPAPGDVYMVDVDGTTQLVTPSYTVTVEEALFPQGVYWEYDEAGLGFDADGSTEACGVLTLYHRGSGAVACRVYLTTDVAPQAAPFEGSYAVAQGDALPSTQAHRPRGQAGLQGHLYLTVAWLSAGVSAQAQADALCASLSTQAPEPPRVYVVAEGAGDVRVVTPYYSVLIPSDLYPQGWGYAFDDTVCDAGTEGTMLWGHSLTVSSTQNRWDCFTVHCSTSNWSGVQGSFAATVVGPMQGDTNWHVVVYAPYGVNGGNALSYNEVSAFVDAMAVNVTVGASA